MTISLRRTRTTMLAAASVTALGLGLFSAPAGAVVGLPSVPPVSGPGSSDLASVCVATIHGPVTVVQSATHPRLAFTISLGGSLCPATARLTGTSTATLRSPSGATTLLSWTDPAKPSYAAVASTAPGDYTTSNGHASVLDSPLGIGAITVNKFVYSTSRSKLITRAALSISRSGATIRFGGYVKHFVPTGAGSYTGSTGRIVYLQKLASYGWTTIRTVRSSAAGAVSTTYPSRTAGTYRWATSETAGTWGTASSPRRV